MVPIVRRRKSDKEKLLPENNCNNYKSFSLIREYKQTGGLKYHLPYLAPSDFRVFYKLKQPDKITEDNLIRKKP